MTSKKLSNNWDYNLIKIEEEINFLCSEPVNRTQRIGNTFFCLDNLARQYGGLQRERRTRQAELLGCIFRFVWTVDYFDLIQDLEDALERKGKQRCGRSATIEHKIIETATEVSKSTRSRWARVIGKARKQKVTPKSFSGWLKKSGGVNGVLDSKKTKSTISASSKRLNSRSEKVDMKSIERTQLERLLNEELCEKDKEQVYIRFFLSDDDTIDFEVIENVPSRKKF